MCGIVGFWSHKALTRTEIEVITTMTDKLVHRGPDAGDTWTDPDRGIALGHRRLSIIDLSVEGAQPMHSRDGRWTVVFNGEIYNHQHLRDALPEHPFRGHSDTESLVEHIAQFGIEDTLNKTNGMFAFAAWDHKTRQLWLARDRIGIKPLFYGEWNGKWIFASELKAFTALPDFCPTLNRDAVTSMLRFNYIPCPKTIYQGIHKLPPGHFICFKDDDSAAQPQPWWTVKDAALRGSQNPLTVSEPQLLDDLQELLLDAVKIRMAADVPLGAFLSGGLDSSTVVALMQAQSSRPIRTFSIGFHEADFNEATHAKAIANHLGTDHTEFYVTAEEARDVIPLIPHTWDEPFSDSSQIPTYLVSKLAKGHVTVSLSGDGGDELFGGYNRYVWANRIWSTLSKAPHIPRRAANRLVPHIPHALFKALDKTLAMTPGLPNIPQFEDKVIKAAALLGAKTPDDVYLSVLSHWKHPDSVVLGGQDDTDKYINLVSPDELPNFIERMMLVDADSYMVDDILTKVDRASMAVSLEARVPLLDHRLFEYAWSIPLSSRIKTGFTKWPLRQILSRYVPLELFERPKMGFGVPIGQWLRGPLKDWGEHLLDEHTLNAQGVFNPTPIRTAWEQLQRGEPKHYLLWDVLMFQAWLAENESNIRL